MNIDRSQISRYENNEDLPSIDILVKFAKVYNTTIDELVGVEEARVNKVSNLLSSLNDNNFKLVILLLEPVITILNKYNV